MLSYLYVAVGSAAGGVARWTLGEWVQQRAGGLPPAVFPFGTLLVNATGSFALGLAAMVLARQPGGEHDLSRLLIAVGFCGGYTTFSTFSLDTVALVESRGMGLAAANVFANLGLGLGGLLAGMALGRMMLRG